MIQINDNNILTGYIKELLHSYNLPNMLIYNEDVPLYENQIYLKDNHIVQYVNGEFKFLATYIEGERFPGYTTTLSIHDNIYDSKTHEYLGEYLRFLRDYKRVNLMSLYNCYSANYPSNIVQSLILEDGNQLTINTNDSTHKLIMIPVKLGQEYTIAISCPFKYEMFCGFYGKDFYPLVKKKTKEQTLTEETIEEPTIQKQMILDSHEYVKSSYFNRPFIYDKLLNVSDNYKESYYSHQKDLKLFIKLPQNCNSTITILEGRYLNTNDYIFAKVQGEDENDAFKPIYNISRPNYTKSISTDEVLHEEDAEEGKVIDYITKDIDTVFDSTKGYLKSKIKLLEMDSTYSFAFSDRLIEYLLENVISPLDKVGDNIKRIQKKLNQIYIKESNTLGLAYIGKYYGKWHDKYQSMLYELAANKGLLNDKTDILGFVDKDLEKKLGQDIDIYNEEGD